MMDERMRNPLSDAELREIAQRYRNDPTIMRVLWDLRRLKGTASRASALLASLDKDAGVPPQVLEARKVALRVMLDIEPWANLGGQQRNSGRSKTKD